MQLLAEDIITKTEQNMGSFPYYLVNLYVKILHVRLGVPKQVKLVDIPIKINFKTAEI